MRIALLTLLLSFSLAAQAVTLKISTLYPDGTSVVEALQKAGKAIAKKTDGRVSLKVYAGGVMGDDSTVQRKIRIGLLQGMLAQSGAFARYYRDSQVYNLPLVFRSYDEVAYVREQMDDVLQQGFAENGWVTFGLVDGGFAYLMTQQPVASVADFQKQKIWLPSGDNASAAAAEVFKLSPVMLPIGGVLTALQTGVVNAFVAPPVASLTLQWFTQADYVTSVPLLYTYGLLAISKKQFMRIDAADRKLVRQVLEKAFDKLNSDALKQNKSAFAAITNQGIKLVKPSDEQLAVWRDYAVKARQVLVENGQVSQQMQDKLMGLLKDYRAAH